MVDDRCSLLGIPESQCSSPTLSMACLGKTSSHHLNKSQMSTGAGMSVGAANLFCGGHSFSLASQDLSGVSKPRVLPAG